VYTLDVVVCTGRPVYTLEATDGDAPVTPGGRVKYRITSGSRDHFVIEDTTGVVRVAAPLSHISNPSYNITVCRLLSGH